MYPELQSFLYFNVSSEEVGNTSINTTINDEWEERWIRDTGIKNYTFALTEMRIFDTGTSTTNIEQMFDTEKFMCWIEEQNKIRNYPIFENAKVISVENLQNIPTFSGVDENGVVAKYMFQIKIKYII